MTTISSILLLACVAQIDGHAQFFMTDALYRTNAKGQMYCKADIDVGQMVMGNAIKTSTDASIDVVKTGSSWKVSFKGPQPGPTPAGFEYILEASAGQFQDGGCGGKRSTLSGDTLIVPANAKSVILKAAWAHCQGEPPVPCQVFITTKTVSVDADPSKANLKMPFGCTDDTQCRNDWGCDAACCAAWCSQQLKNCKKICNTCCSQNNSTMV